MQLRRPRYDDLRQVDLTWPGLRPGDAQQRDWQWCSGAGQITERFGLFIGADCRALWCSTAPRLLHLPAGDCYRLDFLEVHPRFLDSGLGYLAFGMAAARAMELEASAIVLHSLPQAESFYRRMGGVAAPIDGWRSPPDLVSFYFGRICLQERAEYANAFRLEE